MRICFICRASQIDNVVSIVKSLSRNELESFKIIIIGDVAEIRTFSGADYAHIAGVRHD